MLRLISLSFLVNEAHSSPLRGTQSWANELFVFVHSILCSRIHMIDTYLYAKGSDSTHDLGGVQINGIESWWLVFKKSLAQRRGSFFMSVFV